MKLSEAKEGMDVVVSVDCKYTKKDFGWNGDMDKYKRTTQKVKGLSHSGNSIRLVSMDNYNWSAKDLRIASIPEKKSQPFLFDVERLDL